jgi:hypothetical protein
MVISQGKSSWDALVKVVFNRKISVFKRKLNTELRKELVRCYVCNIALYSFEN